MIGRVVARRIGESLVLLVAVTLGAFAMLELAPGDFVSEMRLDPHVSPDTVAALRERYGLTQPLGVRYARWVAAAAQGDLGFSFAYNLPAAPLLWSRALNTLLLTVPAMVIAWTLALLVGIWTAHRKGKWLDRTCAAVTSALAGMPDILLALVAMALAVGTGWFPTGGMRSPHAMGGSIAAALDVAWHACLPVAVLVLGNLPALLRHVRASLIEVLDAPALGAARAHGICERRLLTLHALPLAANPLISLAGFSVATLVSTSLLVEIVLSWPGLGPLLLDAIMARDVHVVLGAVVLSCAFIVAANLAADLALAAVDPRIRTE